MPCGATQDGWVMVERFDRMWSTEEGNGKALQYSFLENPMNSMERQNDRILKEELPRSVGAQYATRDQWRNNSSSILGTYQPWEFLFQYPIILPFHTVHGVLKARILKLFAILFLRSLYYSTKYIILAHIKFRLNAHLHFSKATERIKIHY